MGLKQFLGKERWAADIGSSVEKSDTSVEGETLIDLTYGPPTYGPPTDEFVPQEGLVVENRGVRTKILKARSLRSGRPGTSRIAKIDIHLS